MAQRSAGILLFRRRPDGPQVLLAHPGGPFWARRDAGAWTIPKGEIGPDEDAMVAARREFAEETGHDLAKVGVGAPIPLGEAVQASRKVVIGFAVEGDLDPGAIASNSFEIEWPPKSGRRQSFPEIDRAGWFSLAAAAEKILPGQAVFLQRFAEALGVRR
jgi:predicted NUDIX family NTP pyrophosphohydrolase